MEIPKSISPAEIELADKAEKFKYSKPFTDEELTSKKSSLANFALDIKSIEESF